MGHEGTNGEQLAWSGVQNGGIVGGEKCQWRVVELVHRAVKVDISDFKIGQNRVKVAYFDF